MANYTPTDQFDFNNIPLTGVLVPGATVGYVAEGKYIKGGYIVVQTLDERDALLDKSLYEDREIEVGTPVYVSDEDKTYRYAGQEDVTWVEDTTATEIADLQKEVADQSAAIATKAEAADLQALADATSSNFAATANNFAAVETRVVALEANTVALQEQVKKNTDDIAQRVDGETFFAALMNIDAVINTKASNDFVNQQIGIINSNTLWDSDAPTKHTVGGLEANSYLKGKSVKEVLMMILYGYSVIKPTYEDPTATIVTINNTVGISSDPLKVSGTVSFDRGEILLDGKHQNWRAGKAVSITVTDPSTGSARTYQLPTPGDDRVEELEFAFDLVAVPLGESEVKLKVNYAEGAQPFDSFDDPIDQPYPAGSIETTFKVVGVTNTWSGLSIDDVSEVNNIDGIPVVDPDKYDPAHPEKGQLEGLFKDFDNKGNTVTSGFQVKTAEPTSAEETPIILIQADVTVTGIKVWDLLQGEWHWYSNSPSQAATKEGSLGAFTKLEQTVVKKINNDLVEITYSVYQYAGDPAGEMYFRFYID